MFISYKLLSMAVIIGVQIKESLQEDGGIETTIEAYPFSVYCRIYLEDYGKYITVGGSILNDYLILTSAKFLNYICDMDEPDIVVYFGHTNKYSPDALTRRASRCVVHEEYTIDPETNSIALIMLSARIPLGPQISRVAIMRNPPYHAKRTLVGWDLYRNCTCVPSDYVILKEVEVQPVVHSECLKGDSLLTEGNICGTVLPTGYDGGWRRGDGAPMVVFGYIQIGLYIHDISWHQGEYTTFFTDVGYYYDWIQTTARRLKCGI